MPSDAEETPTIAPPHVLALFQPCPMCSNPRNVVRPEWVYCRHTSRSRGIRVDSVMGCAHFNETVRSREFLTDPAEKAQLVDLWNYRAEQLLEERTELYPPSAKACFVEAIGFSTPAPG